MYKKLKDYITANEEWLMSRILKYAKQRHYTDYTSTLQEAWRMSIAGLSESLLESIDAHHGNLELNPEEDYINDPASKFGIDEAEKHRERGIKLSMFLGLMAYYQQTYQDMISKAPFSDRQRKKYHILIDRFFSRVEIAFCSAWTAESETDLVTELQSANRIMTNEKNKYLTIFESLSIPIYFTDADDIIENFNNAAAKEFDHVDRPGENYYSSGEDKVKITDKLPWLKSLFSDYHQAKGEKEFLHREYEIDGTYYSVSITESLDISGKFTGMMTLIENITETKLIQNERESLIQNLREALSEIKSLQGIIPVCMHCKQVRDDEGYWNELAEYIESHSDAHVSHALCEDCLRTLYPDHYESIIKKQREQEQQKQ